MHIRVCRASDGQVLERALELPAGSTAAEAAAASGLAEGTWCGRLGVFGVAVAGSAPLQDGDRLELLAPLQVDPRTRRRQRAARPG